jgi:putative ABC transport system ATP-binding protein
MNESIIRTENVKKLYRLPGEEVWALKGVSLEIARGEFLSIMGPSGSGKSTFFNQIGALDRPTEGKVFFEGQSIFDLSESRQAWIRCNKIGYIFQTFNLIPVMSALQNVTLPMIFRGESKADAAARGQSILERVGLGHRLHHKPFELSGGQQQRVAIARALANAPSVILADEPTGNLNPHRRGSGEDPPGAQQGIGNHRHLFHARPQNARRFRSCLLDSRRLARKNRHPGPAGSDESGLSDFEKGESVLRSCTRRELRGPHFEAMGGVTLTPTRLLAVG